MNPDRIHRWGVLAVIAFTGPIAAAALLGCGTDTPNQHHTTTTVGAARTPPTGLRWWPFQGVDLPVTNQGPRTVEWAVASGFDRSPAGAAVAAIQATVRTSIATDAQWPQIGARMLAPGPARDAWAVARAQISITAPILDGAPKILGYVVSRYTLDASEVDIYSLHPDNSLTRNHTTVLWQHDDWRLALPDTVSATAPPVTAVAVTPPDLVVLTPR
ncbi:hypothetical protein OG225_06120 [Nocardia sp. NBC_01377]|uniref:hypothetical protein n=1 Tax=Nocardia sp. NBC_01377 TaxID=2903595 RepID=UPI00325321A8